MLAPDYSWSCLAPSSPSAGTQRLVVVGGDRDRIRYRSVVGGVLAIRLRPRWPLRVAVSAFLTLALPPALLAIPAATVAIAVASCAAGLGLIFFNTIFETTVQQRVPPSRCRASPRSTGCSAWPSSRSGSPSPARSPKQSASQPRLPPPCGASSRPPSSLPCRAFATCRAKKGSTSTRLDGQRSLTTQRSHAGRRASQTRRPCQISR